MEAADTTQNKMSPPTPSLRVFTTVAMAHIPHAIMADNTAVLPHQDGPA